jgi:hypothetical protein
MCQYNTIDRSEWPLVIRAILERPRNEKLATPCYLYNRSSASQTIAAITNRMARVTGERLRIAGRACI